MPKYLRPRTSRLPTQNRLILVCRRSVVDITLFVSLGSLGLQGGISILATLERPILRCLSFIYDSDSSREVAFHSVSINS